MSAVPRITSPILPWTSRYTWHVEGGLPHPQFTYDAHPDEAAAERVAQFMLRADTPNGGSRLRLVEVHVKGPKEAYSGWRRIEPRA